MSGKKVLQVSDTVFKVVLVGVSEQPVERPQLPWRAVSGKKPKYGITVVKEAGYPKTHVMPDQKSAHIITTAFSHGNKHDFQLFKDNACEFSEHLHILADTGDQG